MLISKAYFIGENDIPNTDYEEVDSSVNRLISTYEKKYLELVLGLTLANQFKAGLLESTVNPKWIDLRDGAPEYTSLVDDRTRIWNGFVNATTLESPIADYCYYWYLRSNVSNTAGVGEVETAVMNADRVSSKRKQSEAWNRMVRQNLFLFDYLRSNQDLYPDFDYFNLGLTSWSCSLYKRINPYNF